MWNVMLDPYPTEWRGYHIDTDFQIGIMISQCFADDKLSEIEQYCKAAELLFPNEKGRPSFDEAIEAVIWFLNECNHDNKSGDDLNVPVMDYDIDQWRIFSAFKSQYHIDLNTAQMHWFEFIGLLWNLEECSLTRVMNIRQKKITSKMSAEEKQAYSRMKRIFALKPPKKKALSVKEQQAVDDFMKYANINK